MEDLRFDASGLIPAIVQQYDSGEVLMMAYMNAESLQLTLDTKTTWFWSRSRKELWNKGATSGNIQKVRTILYDCDADCLLVEVDSPGPACHTKNRSCFYRLLLDTDAAGEDVSADAGLSAASTTITGLFDDADLTVTEQES